MCGSYVPSIPTSATVPVTILLASTVTWLWEPRTLTRDGQRSLLVS